MTKGKWYLLLALLLGTLLLVGCGSNGDKVTVPGKEPAQQNQEAPKAEEPKAEAPKAEEPKAEAPKAEEPKAEAPKAEEPKAEAPKAEAPKAEAPKAEAPKTEAPKTEAPKTEAPKPAAKPVLNLGHDLSDAYAGKCKTCHAGKAMLDPAPPHNIDDSIGDCATCHTLTPKK